MKIEMRGRNKIMFWMLAIVILVVFPLFFIIPIVTKETYMEEQHANELARLYMPYPKVISDGMIPTEFSPQSKYAMLTAHGKAIRIDMEAANGFLMSLKNTYKVELILNMMLVVVNARESPEIGIVNGFIYFRVQTTFQLEAIYGFDASLVSWDLVSKTGIIIKKI